MTVVLALLTPILWALFALFMDRLERTSTMSRARRPDADYPRADLSQAERRGN